MPNVITYLSDADRAALARMYRIVNNITGDGVSSSGSGITIRPRRGVAGVDAETVYRARLTGRTTTPGMMTWQSVKWDSGAWTNDILGSDDLGPCRDASGLLAIQLGQIVDLEPDSFDGEPVYSCNAGIKWVWAKLTDAATTDTANQWRYAWSEVTMTDSGWSTPTNGLSGTTSSSYAVNALEANNAASGVQGNGVDPANISDGQTFWDAAHGGPIVQIFESIAASGTRLYVFSLANAIDGECE